MLVKNQEILTTWMPTNRQHYIDKGYKYTKCREKVLVKVEDLLPSSHEIVNVICDYCGKEYKKQYVNYLKEHTNNKDCCVNCSPKKVRDYYRDNFGVDNVFQLQETKDKSKKTCLAKYGVDNPSKSDEVKAKIAESNFVKYGDTCAARNKDVLAKTKQTCLDRYGVDNVFKSKEIQNKIKLTNEEKYGSGNIAHTPQISEKIKQSNVEKYGVSYTTQVPEIIAKMRESLMKNGNVASSKPERELCDMLHDIFGDENCIDGYALDRCNMDCLVKFSDCLIDVEYDGKYWHNNREEHDKRRNYWLIKQGYKVLRIKANNKDILPSKEQIRDAIDYLVKDNHSLTYIDMNI